MKAKTLLTIKILWPAYFFYLSWAVLPQIEGVRIIHSANGVAAVENAGRFKRQTSREMSDGFNSAQKQELLDAHNKVRATRRSSNMMRMDWDPELAKSAQAWADRCIFAHSSSRDVPGYRYVGENLYAGTGLFVPASVVQMWFDEWKDYDYNTLRCVPGKMCGHYTQVVWAESRSVGCGVRYCPHLRRASEFGFSSGYNLACHYGPGGNIIGYKPFKKGQACSECPEDAKFCINGLCYHKQASEGTNIDEGDGELILFNSGPILNISNVFVIFIGLFVMILNTYIPVLKLLF